jgi:hypothetical protein
MNISIRPNAFELERLLCLVTTIKEKYPGRQMMGVFVYDSDDAAKGFLPVKSILGFIPGAKSGRDWGWNLRAEYDRDDREEYLKLMPLGFMTNGEFDVRVDLRQGNTLSCRMRVNKRCLLKLDEIKYPKNFLADGIAGTVTLTGIVSADGRVRDIRFAGNHAGYKGKEKALAEDARFHLATWRFEQTGRDDKFTIAFNYIIDESVGIALTDVKVESPERIVIRANKKTAEMKSED